MPVDYDLTTTLRIGSKKPLKVTLDAGSGKTTQIKASPQPKFELYDRNAASVAGYPIDVTTYDTAAIQKPSIWFSLDTTTPTALVSDGLYIGRMVFSHLGSDAETRNEDFEFLIHVLPAVDSVVTYDLNTNVGKTRLWIQDSGIEDTIWSDAEISVFLAEANTPILAAAYALDAEANGAARVSSIIRLGTFSNNAYTVYQALRDSATRLRRLGAMHIGLRVRAPDPVYTMTSDDGATMGTTDLW
jgi:hypothetical protein